MPATTRSQYTKPRRRRELSPAPTSNACDFSQFPPTGESATPSPRTRMTAMDRIKAIGHGRVYRGATTSAVTMNAVDANTQERQAAHTRPQATGKEREGSRNITYPPAEWDIDEHTGGAERIIPLPNMRYPFRRIRLRLHLSRIQLNFQRCKTECRNKKW